MQNPNPRSFVLQIPGSWGAPAHDVSCPRVEATLWLEETALRIRWEVLDSPETFRCEVNEDGGPVWQDSCVELFVNALDGSGDYCNFEFNSRGACLSARGPDRHHRAELDEGGYEQIQRQLLPWETRRDPRLGWVLEVRIPASLLGCTGDLRERTVLGNIYKCGDKTEAPHYLSAFPIRTERPDFHRPEFFDLLYKA
jgi:hypothetical protein